MEYKTQKPTNLQNLLGGKIRNFRKQLGLTQEELAERAGLHYSYIGQVERGDKNPSLNSLRKMAEALNVGVDMLLEETQQYELVDTELLQKELWKITRNRPAEDLQLLLEIAKNLFERLDSLTKKE